MRNNKILAAAIASVVSLSGGAALLGSGEVFAGNVTLITPNAGTPPPFATELFPTGTNYVAGSTGLTTSCGNSNSYVIRYKVPFTASATLSAGNIIKVKATVDNSAGWGTNTDPTNQVQFCATAALTGGVCAAAETYPVTISKSSTVTDTKLSSVEFAIQVTGTVAAASLLTAHLFFCPDLTADNLQNEGSIVSLSMESSLQATLGGNLVTSALGSAESVQIATSKRGLSVLIEEEKTPPVAAISFAADTMKFATGNSKNSLTDVDRVSLGKIDIDPANNAKGRDGSLAYSPSFSGWSGKLTVKDGPFSASQGANQVFLDNDNNCVFDTVTVPASIAATVSGNVATWNVLTDIQLKAIYDNDMYVCVVADGVNAIEEQSLAPTAVLEMGAIQPYAKYQGRLRHIKETGTKCTLFNIPDATESLGTLSTDLVMVRITNNGPDAGTLYATLYDQSGKAIYSPKRQAIGPIEPYQTVVYYTGREKSLPTYDPAFDLAQFGGAQHWVGQRATLIVATELSDVSMFGLVRNRHGGPNMNMSTGATGNGCD